MSTLTVPFSANQQRARASSKYALSEASTVAESDDGSAGVRPRSVPKSSNAFDKRTKSQRDNRRQSQHTLVPIPSQKPSPLRRQSSPSPLHHTKQPLTKNYMHMVKDFNTMKKYAKQPSGEFLATSLCVLCEVTVPRLVFYPCEHRCVCDQCLILNDITNKPTCPTSWTACPICMGDIKLMLPHTEDGEALYWKWALEVAPTLPANFRYEFKEASKRLQRGLSSVLPEGLAKDVLTNANQTKPPQTIKPPTPAVRSMRTTRSIYNSVNSTRRFSLAHRRGSTAATGQGQREARSRCTIL